jgi:trehalose 6-phosphate phosphatase
VSRRAQRPLFPGGAAALRGLAVPSTLFAFDLDGTLAPIVAAPSEARVPEAVRGRMADLCRLARVAVLTGRSVRDAARRLGFSPHVLVGNHGAEGTPSALAREGRFTELARRWEEQLAGALPEALRGGVEVENKGPSLAVHYRGAPDPAAAREAILLAADRLVPEPRRIPGIFVVNLLPADAPLKGEALVELLDGCGAPRALYVGDDETDEEVFRLPGGTVLGVRVGCSPGSRAEWCLEGQEEVGRLLYEILALLRARRRTGE